MSTEGGVAEEDEVRADSEYSSATRKNKILPLATTLMGLGGVRRTEVSQTLTKLPDLTPMRDLKQPSSQKQRPEQRRPGLGGRCVRRCWSEDRDLG